MNRLNNVLQIIGNIKHYMLPIIGHVKNFVIGLYC